MTETQRNYLADLAAKKGVRLEGTDSMSVEVASAKIEELETLPDKEFREITEDEEAHIQAAVNKTEEELRQWIFTR